jgi:hypothetical protein
LNFGGGHSNFTFKKQSKFFYQIDIQNFFSEAVMVGWFISCIISIGRTMKAYTATSRNDIIIKYYSKFVNPVVTAFLYSMHADRAHIRIGSSTPKLSRVLIVTFFILFESPKRDGSCSSHKREVCSS